MQQYASARSKISKNTNKVHLQIAFRLNAPICSRRLSCQVARTGYSSRSPGLRVTIHSVNSAFILPQPIVSCSHSQLLGITIGIGVTDQSCRANRMATKMHSFGKSPPQTQRGTLNLRQRYAFSYKLWGNRHLAHPRIANQKRGVKHLLMPKPSLTIRSLFLVICNFFSSITELSRA